MLTNYTETDILLNVEGNSNHGNGIEYGWYGGKINIQCAYSIRNQLLFLVSAITIRPRRTDHHPVGWMQKHSLEVYSPTKFELETVI